MVIQEVWFCTLGLHQTPFLQNNLPSNPWGQMYNSPRLLPKNDECNRWTSIIQGGEDSPFLKTYKCFERIYGLFEYQNVAHKSQRSQAS